MNIKTYSWVKYIATFGSVLLLTSILLEFLQFWKNMFNSYTTANIVSFILVFVGIGIITLYIWLRNYLKNKSPYKYEVKDRQKLWISFAAYGFASVSALIYIIIAAAANIKDSTMTYLFIPFVIFVLAGMVAGAIYESLSRIQEQIYLYQIRDKKVNETLAAKRSTIVDEDAERKHIEKAINANRTSEADKLLNKSEPKVEKPKKQTKTNPVEAKVETEQYNPFMDTKLNEQLKNDQDFDDWLKNKNKKK